MSGPGPSTLEARARRSARRASEAVTSGAEEKQKAPFPNRKPEGDDEGKKEGEDIDDEDDSEHDNDGNEKQPVYHRQIWSKLLKKGDQGDQLRYVNRDPKSGSDPLDVTAVMSTQVDWDMENRVHWPTNLTLWERPNPWNNPTYDVGVMRYKGHIVLDYAGNPIQDFRIPLTISSQVEGLRIEAWMRSDTRLSLSDIEARMWTKDAPGGGKLPCFDRRTLSKRASNDRVRTGLISWMAKRGRDAQMEFMDSLRTPEQKAANLAIGRDLTRTEKASLSLRSLDEQKQSSAPTREARIRKIKRAAGEDEPVAGSSSGAADEDSQDPAAVFSDEDDDPMDVDSDDEEVVSETQLQEQATGDDNNDENSPPSSIEDPDDSRNEQPVIAEEEESLQRALQITIDQFIGLTGQQPDWTDIDKRDNYFSQYGMLQSQFRVLWRAMGEPVVDQGPPWLIGRGRWTGGIAQFEFAEVEVGRIWIDEEQEEGA